MFYSFMAVRFLGLAQSADWQDFGHVLETMAGTARAFENYRLQLHSLSDLAPWPDSPELKGCHEPTNVGKWASHWWRVVVALAQNENEPAPISMPRQEELAGDSAVLDESFEALMGELMQGRSKNQQCRLIRSTCYASCDACFAIDVLLDLARHDTWLTAKEIELLGTDLTSDSLRTAAARGLIRSRKRHKPNEYLLRDVQLQWPAKLRKLIHNQPTVTICEIAPHGATVKSGRTRR